jgi:hypothetical protein
MAEWRHDLNTSTDSADRKCHLVYKNTVHRVITPEKHTAVGPLSYPKFPYAFFVYEMNNNI